MDQRCPASIRRTPRTLSVVTLSAHSMNGCDGGCMDLVLARVTTSSFVLDGWIFMLLVSAHFLILSYSSVTVPMLLERTNMQVGVVGKFCNLVLPVLRMEVRGFYHICRRA